MKRKQQPIDDRCDLAPLGSARLSASRVPQRIRIAPWGEVESTRGRFVVDEESAEKVVSAFESHGADLPIDYEHQTLGGEFASPSGQAPAAGWIKRIEAEPRTGLFARVEWTKPALKQLAARQYRYLSPVALVRRADRKLVGLHSVALTSKPAIVGAEPIVNTDACALDALLEDVLGPDAHQDDARGDHAMEALRSRLDLAPESDLQTVLLAAERRIADFDAERRRHDAQLRLETAMRAGRVVEAQREFAMRLALADATLFDEWLATAPVIVPLGRTAGPGALPELGRRRAIEARARAEFRANPGLADLTDEQAYVHDALRAVEIVNS